jgi:hypothetical protein
MIHWKELDTEGKCEAIRSVWKPGMSASQIAAAISREVTRNAIIGMFQRHWDKLEGVSLSASRGAVPFNRTPRKKRVRASRSRKPVYAPKMAAADYDATAIGLPLHELSSRQCHWPVNDVPPGGVFLFCGHDVSKGHYCADHHYRSTQHKEG